ncbi:MAG: hypothetical protein V7K57_27525 [Nostoc sp.]
MSFFNTSMIGGFAGIVSETKEEYESHICYIDAVKCWAESARFGGIVIETMIDSDLPNH